MPDFFSFFFGILFWCTIALSGGGCILLLGSFFFTNRDMVMHSFFTWLIYIVVELFVLGLLLFFG